MKTRRLFYMIIATTMAIMTTSCGPNPQDYQEQIEDGVKYHISILNSLAERINDMSEAQKIIDLNTIYSFYSGKSVYDKVIEDFDKLDDAVIELYNDKKSDYNFEQALELLSNSNEFKYHMEAYSVLDNYRNMTIRLSDYERISTSSKTEKVWRFKELKTGLIFYFNLTDNGNGKYKWEVEGDEDSRNKYLSKKIK